MFTIPSHLPRYAAAIFGCFALVVPCDGQEPSPQQLQNIIIDLQEQQRVMQQSLAEANKAEAAANAQLARVRERLEALGRNLLDGGDDRLLQAAADLKISEERLVALEGAATRLTSTVKDYVRQAVVADPDARMRLETSLRELDGLLEFSQKPRPDVRNGSLQQATVVSVDQESGMLVLNLGERQDAAIGMQFHLFRNDLEIGKIILVDVRKAVCGAFVEIFDESAGAPRIGDLAVLITQ